MSSKCSARCHLRGADFAVYDASRQLTAKAREEGKGPICSASIATLVRMTSYCGDTVTVVRKRLVQSGWWKPVAGTNWINEQKRTRAKRGHFQAPRFFVIEHQDWAKEHAGECGRDNDSTVAEFSVHGQTVHGSNGDGGIRKTVHGKPRHRPSTVDSATKPLSFKPERDKPKFSLPDFVPVETWECFVEQRAKSKKPMTDSAMKLVCDKLRRLSGGKPDIAKRILEQSVERGWMSVFPLPDEQNAEPEEISDEEFNRREMERLFGAKESDDRGIRRKREQEQKQRVS